MQGRSSFNLLMCNSVIPQIMLIVFMISQSHSCTPSEEMHFCLAHSPDFLFCLDSIRIHIKHRLDYCHRFCNLCSINVLVTCISQFNTTTDVCPHPRLRSIYCTLRDVWQRYSGSILNKTKRIFSTPKCCSYWLWDQTSFPFKVYRQLFLWE